MIQQLYDFLFISGIFGIVFGALLLVTPYRVFKVRSPLRQWLFESDLISLLDRTSRIERPIYRYHRPIGAAVTAGSLILLFLLKNLQDYLFTSSNWTNFLGVRFAMIFSWSLAALSLVIGIFLFVRPSALKGFEKVANRWVEPLPKAGQGKEADTKGVSALILKYPRYTGVLLLSFGIGCLWAAFSFSPS